jgi:hypothetical protein
MQGVDKNVAVLVIVAGTCAATGKVLPSMIFDIKVNM